jgi:hypothetical protein
MQHRLALVLPCLAVALSGCGTIMHGTMQEIAIVSAPAGAEVSVDGAAVGRTPLNVRLKRKQAHQVRIEAAGYLPYETALSRTTSVWLWPDILGTAWLLAPLPIDALSGGLYELKPSLVSAALIPRSDTLGLAAAPVDDRSRAAAPAANGVGGIPLVGRRVVARGSDNGAWTLDGTVTAIRGDTLELMTISGRMPLTLPLARVETLAVFRGSRGHARQGGMVGAMVGLAGSIYAAAHRSDWSCKQALPGQGGEEVCSMVLWLGVFLLPPTTALIGAGIGALVKTDTWETVPLRTLRLGVRPLRDGRLGLGASFNF